MLIRPYKQVGFGSLKCTHSPIFGNVKPVSSPHTEDPRDYIQVPESGGVRGPVSANTKPDLFTSISLSLSLYIYI